MVVIFKKKLRNMFIYFFYTHYKLGLKNSITIFKIAIKLKKKKKDNYCD